MSASVNSSSNPYAYLQSLWQQKLAIKRHQCQVGAIRSIAGLVCGAGSGQRFVVVFVVNFDERDGFAGTTASSAGGPQFGPQTLQALFSLQANATDGQSSGSQAGGLGDSSDPTQQAQKGEGHHHHHHGGGGGGLENLLNMLNSSTSGATSQTAANSNGSSTTTIDYSDGSSISLTSAPGSSTSSSGTLAVGSGTIGGQFLDGRRLERVRQQSARAVDPDAGAIAQHHDAAEHRDGLSLSSKVPFRP